MFFPQAKKDDKREEETGQPPREHVNWAEILPPFFSKMPICAYAVYVLILELEVLNILQVRRLLQ